MWALSERPAQLCVHRATTALDLLLEGGEAAAAVDAWGVGSGWRGREAASEGFA